MKKMVKIACQKYQWFSALKVFRRNWLPNQLFVVDKNSIFKQFLMRAESHFRICVTPWTLALLMYHSPPGSFVYFLAGSGKLICYRILKGLIEKKIIIKQPVYLLPF
jgi:hypothetical protein